MERAVWALAIGTAATVSVTPVMKEGAGPLEPVIKADGRVIQRRPEKG